MQIIYMRKIYDRLLIYVYRLLVLYMLFILGVEALFGGGAISDLFFIMILVALFINALMFVLERSAIIRPNRLLDYMYSIAGGIALIYMIFSDISQEHLYFFRLEIYDVLFYSLPACIFVILFVVKVLLGVKQQSKL